MDLGIDLAIINDAGTGHSMGKMCCFCIGDVCVGLMRNDAERCEKMRKAHLNVWRQKWVRGSVFVFVAANTTKRLNDK